MSEVAEQDPNEAACINHPSELTRVRCGSCGDPICPRCMRETPVGMKCPSCARLPRHARGLGKPSHYLKAMSLAGLLAGACIYALSVFGMRPGLFASLAIGYLAGETSRRVAPLGVGAIKAATAAATVIGMGVGVLLTGVPLAFLWAPVMLVSFGVAATVAAVRAGA